MYILNEQICKLCTRLSSQAYTGLPTENISLVTEAQTTESAFILGLYTDLLCDLDQVV